MKKDFILVDEEGSSLFVEDKDKSFDDWEPKRFDSRPQAEEAAVAEAQKRPGQDIRVYELVSVVIAPVGEPEFMEVKP